MDFGITQATFGQRPFLQLSKTDFDQIVFARKGLFEIVGVEEKFDLLLENYKEIEQELLNLSLRNMMYGDLSWDTFNNQILVVNRRVLNFLSSTRLYLDHLMHSASTLSGVDAALHADVKSYTAEQYDSIVGYRILESLRNYTQHRGMPVRQLTIHYGRPGRVGLSADPLHTLTPSLEVKQLLEDPKFKKQIAQELRAMGEYVDLKPLIRGFVVGLGNVHMFVRDRLNEHVQNWEQLLIGALDRYTKEGDERFPDHVDVVERDDNGLFLSTHTIVRQMISRRKDFVAKNSKFPDYVTNYVTAESI